MGCPLRLDGGKLRGVPITMNLYHYMQVQIVESVLLQEYMQVDKRNLVGILDLDVGYVLL